jgi:hypothetical protein
MLWRYNITDTRDVTEAGKRTEKYTAHGGAEYDSRGCPG